MKIYNTSHAVLESTVAFSCSIYEKLVSFCNLNETGTNYPKVSMQCSSGEVASLYGFSFYSLSVKCLSLQLIMHRKI